MGSEAAIYRDRLTEYFQVLIDIDKKKYVRFHTSSPPSHY